MSRVTTDKKKKKNRLKSSFEASFPAVYSHVKISTQLSTDQHFYHKQRMINNKWLQGKKTNVLIRKTCSSSEKMKFCLGSVHGLYKIVNAWSKWLLKEMFVFCFVFSVSLWLVCETEGEKETVCSCRAAVMLFKEKCNYLNLAGLDQDYSWYHWMKIIIC